MNNCKGRQKNDQKAKPNNNKLNKQDSMFLHFAKGKKLHRFQAESLGDHCLHSTISTLQVKHGITFRRVIVKVPNRFGTTTPVKQYWLEGINLLKARKKFHLEKNIKENDSKTAISKPLIQNI